MKGRGTRGQIFLLRQIIEKAREFNTPLDICFVDFRKAFDSVIWMTLRRWYSSSTTVDVVLSNTFKTESGARQVCIQFRNIYIEHVMYIVLDGWDSGISVGGHVINKLRYADDTNFLSKFKEDLEELLNRL